MAFSSSTVSIGAPTKKADYDRLLDNTIYLKELLSGTVLPWESNFEQTVTAQQTTTVGDPVGVTPDGTYWKCKPEFLSSASMQMPSTSDGAVICQGLKGSVFIYGWAPSPQYNPTYLRAALLSGNIITWKGSTATVDTSSQYGLCGPLDATGTFAVAYHKVGGTYVKCCRFSGTTWTWTSAAQLSSSRLNPVGLASIKSGTVFRFVVHTRGNDISQDCMFVIQWTATVNVVAKRREAGSYSGVGAFITTNNQSDSWALIMPTSAGGVSQLCSYSGGAISPSELSCISAGSAGFPCTIGENTYLYFCSPPPYASTANYWRSRHVIVYYDKDAKTIMEHVLPSFGPEAVGTWNPNPKFLYQRELAAYLSNGIFAFMENGGYGTRGGKYQQYGPVFYSNRREIFLMGVFGWPKGAWDYVKRAYCMHSYDHTKLVFAAEVFSGSSYYSKLIHLRVPAFVGVATESVAPSEDLTIRTKGIVTGLSGLVAGNSYSLNYAQGTMVKAAPGMLMIGRAVSSSALVVE